MRLNLAENEEQTGSFPVPLTADAGSRAQAVRVTFEIQADQNYKFTIYRSINVRPDRLFELSPGINAAAQ